MMIINKIYKTHPDIVHCPRYSQKSLWKFIVKKYNPSKEDNIEDLAIITWNNKESSILEKCLDSKNLNYFSLGKKQKKWNNFLKFDFTLDFLKKNNFKYVLAMDSFDVIVVGKIKNVFDKFLVSNKKIIFNGEKKFYPDLNISYFIDCKKFQEETEIFYFKFLNSGVWIGERNFCIDFFEKCIEIKNRNPVSVEEFDKINNCDQSIVHYVYKYFYPQCSIDSRCIMFQNLSNISYEVDIKNGIL